MRWVIVAGMLVLCGACSFVRPTPLWVSVNDGALSKYSKLRVAVLPPVVARPIVAEKGFTSGLQEVIRKNGGAVALEGLYVVVEWPEGVAEELSRVFPPGPDDFARVGERLGVEAVLATTVYEYAKKTSVSDARLVASVQLIDVAKRLPVWQVARLWESPSVDLLSAIDLDLMSVFNEVKWQARTRTSLFVSTAKPLENVPDIVVAASRRSLFTTAGSVKYGVVAASIAGIAEISVVSNGRMVASYTTETNAGLTCASTATFPDGGGCSQTVVYKGIEVPIDLGTNVIKVSATSGTGELSTKEVTVKRVAAISPREQLVVALDRYADFEPVSDAVNRGQWMDARLRGSGVLSQKLLDNTARVDLVKRGLEALANRNDESVPGVFYFAGRMEVSGSSLRLLLYDSESESDVTTLNLPVDFRLTGRRAVWIIDGCSDASLTSELLSGLVSNWGGQGARGSDLRGVGDGGSVPLMVVAWRACSASVPTLQSAIRAGLIASKGGGSSLVKDWNKRFQEGIVQNYGAVASNVGAETRVALPQLLSPFGR